MTGETVEARANALALGAWGSAEGKQIAAFLVSIGRRDIVEGFFAWVDIEGSGGNSGPKLLRNWLERSYPDLYDWYKARQRVLG